LELTSSQAKVTEKVLKTCLLLIVWSPQGPAESHLELNVTSAVRADKVYTLSKDIVRKNLDR